jgi:O-antigen chain-terminating methyltransferase
MRRFEYADYEADPRLRDPELISGMQAPYAEHFTGCRQVLDLACGSGIFLGLLSRAGIPAIGIERNEQVAAAAKRRGLEVICADAFDYLAHTSEQFDGIFCAHFIEHLAFDRLLLLIELIADRIETGGRLVLVFPNPESIRMQLFGFWKDPEHVRFYHADLVGSVCRHYGLPAEWINTGDSPLCLEPPTFEPLPPDARGRQIVSADDPAMPQAEPAWRRLLGRVAQRLGLATRHDLQELQRELRCAVDTAHQRLDVFAEGLEQSAEAHNRRAQRAVDVLNQIVARPDEVVMVCRKQEGSRAR